MSHLTPTPRTDKNGRTVIRHMKVQRPGSAASLPLLPVIPEQDKRQLVSEVATFITTGNYLEHHFDSAKTAIAEYSLDTLHRIVGNLSKQHMNLLLAGFTMEWDEDKVNDYISIAAAAENNGIYSEELGWHLQSFAYYEELTSIQPGHSYPLHRALQCHAIVDTVTAIHSHADDDSDGAFANMDDGEFLPYIQDAQLRELILHSDEREAVTRIVKERGITDVDTIMEFIHSEAPAVANGLL